MASSLKNLSEFTSEPNVDPSIGKIGIAVAEWNEQVTAPMLDGAMQLLEKYGFNASKVEVITVPGSFELIYGAAHLARKEDIKAVITIGCVVRGDTPHFDYICQGVANGIAKLNTELHKPVIFGVLTTDTLEQAKDRAGGKHGNKGDEAAYTALKMLSI